MIAKLASQKELIYMIRQLNNKTDFVLKSLIKH